MYLFEDGFCSFGFESVWHDVVGGDDEFAVVEFDFGAPAPVGSAHRVGITAKSRESVLDFLANAEHNGRVRMERVHPAGFVLIQLGVVAKGEHAMLGFAFNGGLIEEEREATI